MDHDLSEEEASVENSPTESGTVQLEKFVPSGAFRITSVPFAAGLKRASVPDVSARSTTREPIGGTSSAEMAACVSPIGKLSPRAVDGVPLLYHVFALFGALVPRFRSSRSVHVRLKVVADDVRRIVREAHVEDVPCRLDVDVEFVLERTPLVGRVVGVVEYAGGHLVGTVPIAVLVLSALREGAGRQILEEIDELAALFRLGFGFLRRDLFFVCHDDALPLLRFAVYRMLSAETAVLFQFNAIRSILAVFLGVVIALFAFSASQYNVGAGFFRCHGYNTSFV